MAKEATTIEVGNFLEVAPGYTISLSDIVAYSKLLFEVAELTEEGVVDYYQQPYTVLSLAIFAKDATNQVRPFYLTTYIDDSKDNPVATHIEDVFKVLDKIFLPLRKRYDVSGENEDGIYIGKSYIRDIVTQKEKDVIDEYTFIDIEDKVRVRRDVILAFNKEEPEVISDASYIEKYQNLVDDIVDSGEVIVVPHRSYSDHNYVRHSIKIETKLVEFGVGREFSLFIPIDTEENCDTIYKEMKVFVAGIKPEEDNEVDAKSGDEFDGVHREGMAEEVTEEVAEERMAEENNDGKEG